MGKRSPSPGSRDLINSGGAGNVNGIELINGKKCENYRKMIEVLQDKLEVLEIA